MFGRNGKRSSKNTELVVARSVADGGWSETKRGPSRVWVVIKLPTDVPEGAYKHSTYSSAPSKIENQRIYSDIGDGLEAIQKLYREEYDIRDEEDRDKCDGRYIALDFYGGERVEALVHGEWKVAVDVAPPALGPPG